MVIKSLHADLDIPSLDLWEFLFERKDKPFPDDKEIYIDAENPARAYTFAQARDLAASFGAGLRARWGFGKGDVLGFCAPNGVDYAPAFFGAHWAGGAATTANPAYTAGELAFQLRDSGARGVVAHLASLPLVREAAREAGLPADRVVLIGDARDPEGRVPHFTELRDERWEEEKNRRRGKGGTERPFRVDAKKDLAFLVYSSGTTGLPKGVMLTHYNIVSNLMQLAHVERLNGLYHSGGQDGKGDKQLAILPFFHVYGLTCIALASVYLGVQAIILPKFDLERACAAIQAHGATFASVPPPVVLALAKSPLVSRYDLSSIKFLNSGAAPLGRELVEQVWRRLTIPVMQGYGLSETSPTLTKGVIADWARYNGSVGKLMPNVEAKIVDVQTGEELLGGTGPDREGELWVRGPNVFPGYLNRPELAAETFSEDGFFKTGDIGYIDDKGNLYITDRLKELIKYKGFQVAPAELEGLLLGHPDVADACVISAHDRARETEVPRAYVVLRDEVKRAVEQDNGQRKEEKAREIAGWLAARVANHKQLRGGVRFVDQVPKNASGKLLRRVLRDEARREDARAEGPKL
ncbi:hypothetical protein F5X96DRAFT_681391 [Biscogniauxia mediterranea]|nr:hypothetical protein F5X96DRAFT_681391 [Biscogniauxia mediterranea]